MSRIRIQNFGPIKSGLADNDGWIDIKKVTVFTGNQGSGKSTVAKLISTFTWIEKALVRGDYEPKFFERKNKLKNQYLNFHRLENYFKDNGRKTHIEYEGDAFSISYKNGLLSIRKTEGRQYNLPQIMYVPAERNFIAYVRTPKELKLSSESLKEFLTEFENAKQDIKGAIRLPINDTELEYDRLNDVLNIRGLDYKVKLFESSSGFQSLVPLFLVSGYLAKSIKDRSSESMSQDQEIRFKKDLQDILENENLSSEQKKLAVSLLSSRFNKTAFINIVEEPEQNLYPSSQRALLFNLLEYNNTNRGNKLIITTHSPFLINYCSIAVKAGELKAIIKHGSVQEKRLESLVPLLSTVNKEELSIYECNDENGSIKKLETYSGIPSDDNQLNIEFDETNELFAQLLDLNQSL
ncbi:MAG: ATP-binding protein [Bacteroidia bacterium]|nr:ATP-binding protein [Bacteroidia bacterium]